MTILRGASSQRCSESLLADIGAASVAVLAFEGYR